MASYGFVYVLTNRCMPNVYKIGYTDRSPIQRAEELSSSTSIPAEFDVFYYIECENPRIVESDLHARFYENRISENREFFDFTIKEIHLDLIPLMQEYCIHYCETEFFLNSQFTFVNFSNLKIEDKKNE